ncbi:N-formylglutamate amidohydrolase [Mesorhizobium sp. ANAO-SY3R2]|uniref:N-formylglutamate amidohydrolase n=1 Tax=Mesorhizobium sp. ANAO-SY3R2 TaxID=3166644 RepID=UPI003672FE40
MGLGQVAFCAESNAVRVTNRDGRSPYVILCDHASNYLPESYGTLGLGAGDMLRHIAWDPGALPVAARMAEALDATLVESCVSRLAIDCNRPLGAHDLIPEVSETTVIPGNTGLDAAQREARIALSWQPFHGAIEGVVSERLRQGRDTRLVSVHSFTPVFKGFSRPWHIGIIHDEDERLSAPMISALRTLDGVTVGVNEPYSPEDRVYFTLEHHGRSRGLPCAMIEIRNDEIADETSQARWAHLLTSTLGDIRLPDGGSMKDQRTHQSRSS